MILATVLERVSAHLEVLARPSADHPAVLQAGRVLTGAAWVLPVAAIGDNTIDLYIGRDSYSFVGGNA